MKLTIAVAAVLQLAAAGHVSVRMPFLNPAGVTYLQGQHSYAVPSAYAAAPQYASHEQLAYAAQQQQLAYEGHNPYSGQVAYEGHNPYNGQVAYEGHNPYNGQVAYQQQLAYAGAPVAVGYAQVPVKAAVAVPTVHHVPAVADVPVTKIEAQHGVIQKIVDVAKPAIKTQKYEIRRPAIQKQFYDIEQRTIVRPVGSALVELDEPLSKSEKGPAVITSLEDHHHKQISGHGVDIAAPVIPQVVAVTPASHTVSITPSAHNVGIASSHGSYPEQSIAQHYPQQVIVSSTPAPIHFSNQEPIYVSSTPASYHESEDSIIVDAAAKHLASAEHAAVEAKHAHQEAVARAQYNAEASAHQEAVARENYNAQAHHEEAVARANYNAQAIAERDAIARANYAHAHQQEAVARAGYSTQYTHEDAIARANADYNAQKEAIDRANYNAEIQAHEQISRANAQANAHLAVESHSNGAPQETIIVKNTPVDVKSLNHLSHEEAQENQQKLLRLLTAKGGVAEIGFGREGPAEHVGDAGISRARVLSATPSPLHEPIEEKTNTRRIVVSRPVHTLQEIDVIQPATKVERVAINQPTIIKTAKLGYERIQTSVPVYGKALAPAIAHAQVPVGYYH